MNATKREKYEQRRQRAKMMRKLLLHAIYFFFFLFSFLSSYFLQSNAKNNNLRFFFILTLQAYNALQTTLNAEQALTQSEINETENAVRDLERTWNHLQVKKNFKKRKTKIILKIHYLVVFFLILFWLVSVISI